MDEIKGGSQVDSTQIQNNFEVQFSGNEIPKLIELKSSDHEYYLAGRDNRWFQHLLDLYFESSIHAAILQNLHLKILNLEPSGFTSLTYQECLLDYLIFGGFALEVIWNLDHTQVLKAKHLDFTKVRSGMVDEETGEVSSYVFSNDWYKYNNRNLQRLCAYSTSKTSDVHQIYYYKRYSPQADIYPKPYYYSCVRWLYTDVQLEKYYSALVKNNFVGNIILSVNSYMDQEKQQEFERSVRKHFTGAENAGGIMVMYSESKENAPEIVEFNKGADDQKYQWLTDKVVEQIAMGHQVPTPLIGMLVPGKLGAASELPTYDAVYTKTIVETTKAQFDYGYNIVKNKMLGL